LADEARIEHGLARIREPDPFVARAAQAELDGKTKPRGSLGRLERLAVQLAAIAGTTTPEPLRAVIVVAAADHGYADEGVSAYPQEVTHQMLANFANGGAAVTVLARELGADVVVVDAGVSVPLEDERIRALRIGPGTANATRGPAMTRKQAVRAIAAGLELADELATRGATALVLGEMGIGNTTAASALHAELLGVAAAEVCGPGTGLDADGVRRKVAVVERALAANSPVGPDPIDALARLGGFEIAFLAGVALGGAANRIAVVLDGFIVCAAALVAALLSPMAPAYFVAAHVSTEPGHALGLQALGLEPLLDLDLRLGEGSGGALALPLLRAARSILVEMATFATAGVTDAGR
jgi:nicotinate-nucleotide--dimethylbenzimidazole phosphoribosyltransferase